MSVVILQCDECGQFWGAPCDIDCPWCALQKAKELLREMCIAYENNPVDSTNDKRLRLIGVFHTWYERAKEVCDGTA